MFQLATNRLFSVLRSPAAKTQCGVECGWSMDRWPLLTICR